MLFSSGLDEKALNTVYLSSQSPSTYLTPLASTFNLCSDLLEVLPHSIANL